MFECVVRGQKKTRFLIYFSVPAATRSRENKAASAALISWSRRAQPLRCGKSRPVVTAVVGALMRSAPSMPAAGGKRSEPLAWQSGGSS